MTAWSSLPPVASSRYRHTSDSRSASTSKCTRWLAINTPDGGFAASSGACEIKRAANFGLSLRRTAIGCQKSQVAWTDSPARSRASMSGRESEFEPRAHDHGLVAGEAEVFGGV